MASDIQEELERRVRPGCTVALADGVGSPLGLCAGLSAAARAAGGVRLILGWCPELPATLDLSAFADVRAFMPGHGLRPAVAAGAVRYVPVYLSQLPALFAGRWRPDVLILAVRETSRGLSLGTEVSWINVAARAAGACVAELGSNLPCAVRRNALADVDVTVISESDRSPVSVTGRPIDPVCRRIGAELARFVTPGAAVQFGPGPVGEAFVAALEVPVRIDSGIATDALVGLDARGLLIGDPVATYLSGTAALYDWADGRGILDGVEVTHNQSRLESADLVAVNTALQIDLLGQVALDGPPGGLASGIGGHADYAAAASRSAHGVSVIALPSHRRGQPTLVDRLAVPVSTPRSVVDVVVTEHGQADLRGLSDGEREQAIAALFR